MKTPPARRVRRYASVIGRWVVIGTVVFSLTMAVGYYITNDVMPRVYTASTMLQLPTSDLVPTSDSALELQPEFVNTIMSPELLLAVVKDLGLEKEWGKRLYNSAADEVPDVDALTRIEKLVKIHIKHGTNFVVITAASDLPQEAAAIANAVATRYQTFRDAPPDDGGKMQPSRVRIVERAAVPTEPTKPNKAVDFVVTIVSACVLSLLVASFVEMILLFIRAGERAEGDL